MSTLSSIALDPRRVRGLSLANARLLVRNRLTLTYALVLPLLPLLLLLVTAEDPVAGVGTVSTALLLVLLFPVYYNLLSVVVTRRDELVLKRLRTGETRDAELVTSLALPGAVVAVVLSALVVPLALLAGMPLPQDLLLYAVALLLAVLMLTAFAMWTAAWTRTAESAQLTSAPVILLLAVGSLVSVLPGPVAEVVALTPGGALDSVVRLAWLGLPPGAVLPGGETPAVEGFAATWAAAAEPLLVLVLWTAVAVALARRSMRWEPRA